MEQFANRPERQNWIDCVRAMGILWILFSHIGFYIPGISELAVTFYVPIFFVLAGWLYQPKEETLPAFLKRKAVRLLIPYFGYSIFLWLFSYGKNVLLTAQGADGMLRSLFGILYARNSLYPAGQESNIQFMTVWNAPAWFLPALFLTEVLGEFLFRYCRQKGKHIELFVLCSAMAGILFHWFCPVLLPWSLDSVFLFLIFYYAGYFAHKTAFLDQTEKKKWLLPAGFFAVAAGRILNGACNFSVAEYGRSVTGGILTSIIASLIVIYFAKKYCNKKNFFINGMASIGQCTLHIMCLHLFLFMFIETAFELLLPGMLSESGYIGDFVKIVVVFMTIDIITVFVLLVKKYCEYHKRIR